MALERNIINTLKVIAILIELVFDMVGRDINEDP